MGCGHLDVHTGLLRYASAGHEPPLLLEVGGNVEPLTGENGPALGVEPVAKYPLIARHLAPGDTLVLYTDGVTEAAASDGALFGSERLSELLRVRPAGDEPEALVRRIVDAVSAHAADFHATDDLTVLAVTFAPPDVTAGVRGGSEHWLVRPEASPAGIHVARQRLRTILTARCVAVGFIDDVELITEELLTNIVRAAGGGDALRLTLELELTRVEILLTIHDNGAAFDPLSRASPKLDAEIADRDVGGLGIHLVRELADECRYARIDGRNVVTIRLNRKAT
jgi:sigma-B regulation protein RsbU (phosphoserine phosphatase)